MKNTKKLVALLIVLALAMACVFVLVACEEPETFELTYVLGEHAAANATAPEAKEYKEGAKVNLEAAPAAADNWQFAGWSDGTNVYQAGAEFTMPANAVTLTAQWTFVGSGTGVAYGLVHGQGYVGKATLTLTNGAITAATLDEACFPTQVKASAEDGEFTVAVGTNNFYKTVKWASVTAIHDGTEYKVGEQTLVEFFSVEANARDYFEAVAANKVTVVTSEGDKDDIMTADTLLKSKNNYWGSPAASALGWKANVEATIAYVKANGFGGFPDGLTRDDLAGEDYRKDNSETNEKLDNEVVDQNGVATGATWTDFQDYFYLLKRANNNVFDLNA